MKQTTIMLTSSEKQPTTSFELKTFSQLSPTTASFRKSGNPDDNINDIIFNTAIPKANMYVALSTGEIIDSDMMFSIWRQMYEVIIDDLMTFGVVDVYGRALCPNMLENVYTLLNIPSKTNLDICAEGYSCILDPCKRYKSHDIINMLTTTYFMRCKRLYDLTWMDVIPAELQMVPIWDTFYRYSHDDFFVLALPTNKCHSTIKFPLDLFRDAAIGVTSHDEKLRDFVIQTENVCGNPVEFYIEASTCRFSKFLSSVKTSDFRKYDIILGSGYRRPRGKFLCTFVKSR